MSGKEGDNEREREGNEKGLYNSFLCRSQSPDSRVKSDPTVPSLFPSSTIDREGRGKRTCLSCPSGS